jgi:hypothetical protein
MRNMLKPAVAKAAFPLAKEIFLGWRQAAPTPPVVHSSLREAAHRMAELTRDLSYEFKQASKQFGEKVVSRQAVQARLADAAIYLHAWACTLSKINKQIEVGTATEQEKTAAMHFFDLAEHAIEQSFRELHDNADDSMLTAAASALAFARTLPDSDYVVPEKSPAIKPAAGQPKPQQFIKQFPGEKHLSDSPETINAMVGKGSGESNGDGVNGDAGAGGAGGSPARDRVGETV